MKYPIDILCLKIIITIYSKCNNALFIGIIIIFYTSRICVKNQDTRILTKRYQFNFHKFLSTNFVFFDSS